MVAGRGTSATPPQVPGLQYVRPLGGGGFADILLYEQDFPRRAVAVKVMSAHVSDREHAAIFEREADALARVSSHPSILTIYSASVAADGRPYLVLEYCPESVGSTFRSSPKSVAEVLALGVSIASALETCHRSGILHRDIKPSNLLVNSYGKTVLADFGIVGSVSDADDGYFGLSIPWSAPEVISGRSVGSVSTEIWGLSATLYALLAGRSPFEVPGPGQNVDALLSARIIAAKYPPIGRADVPAELERVLEQGLSRDPARRQASAMEFAQQLQETQRSLGLAVTELDIPAPAQMHAPLATGDSLTARSVVRSEVPAESKRRRAQQQRQENLSAPKKPQSAKSAARSKTARLIGIAVAAAVVVGAVLWFWLGA